MGRANLTEHPLGDQRSDDRRKTEDPAYSGEERRKGERRKHER